MSSLGAPPVPAIAPLVHRCGSLHARTGRCPFVAWVGRSARILGIGAGSASQMWKDMVGQERCDIVVDTGNSDPPELRDLGSGTGHADQVSGVDAAVDGHAWFVRGWRLQGTQELQLRGIDGEPEFPNRSREQQQSSSPRLIPASHRAA